MQVGGVSVEYHKFDDANHDAVQRALAAFDGYLDGETLHIGKVVITSDANWFSQSTGNSVVGYDASEILLHATSGIGVDRVGRAVSGMGFEMVGGSYAAKTTATM